MEIEKQKEMDIKAREPIITIVNFAFLSWWVSTTLHMLKDQMTKYKVSQPSKLYPHIQIYGYLYENFKFVAMGG